MDVDSKIIKSHSNIIEDDENDEVLCEFEVILNTSLEDSLKLLQFPLIPSDKQFANNKLAKITKNDYYYEFDYQTSKKVENESSKYTFNRLNSQNSNFIDQTVKFSLKGEKIFPNTNYCVVIMKDNILYLNPLNEIIQLRSFPTNTNNTLTTNKTENKLDLVEISRIIDKLTSKDVKISNQNVGFNNVMSVKHFNKINNSALDDEKDKHSKINIIPFSIDSNESKSIVQKLFNAKKIEKGNTNKILSEEDYYNFLYDGITQITVAEQLYEFATNTKTIKELDNMKLKEKIEYYFSKCSIIQFERLISLCMYKKLMNFSDSSFAKGVIEEFSKQMINNITFYCKFVTDNILCLKTEFSFQDENERKKIDLLLKKLNEKKYSKNDLIRIGISNLNKALETYSEVEDGIYFLKGNSNFKREDDKIGKNIVLSSLIDYTKLSSEEIEQIIRIKVKLGLASKIESDESYFNKIS